MYVLRVTFLGIGAQRGGRFYPKLNKCLDSIANKYHEGKMKRTLRRELKLPEIAENRVDGWKVCGEIAVRQCALCILLCKHGCQKELRECAVFLSVGVYASSSSRMEPDGFLCARASGCCAVCRSGLLMY